MLQRIPLLCIMCFLLICPSVHAKVLFLAHWNGSLKAEIAAGKADPVIAGGPTPPKIGDGYAFKNSMPAINGLQIGDGSNLAYATAGNMNAAEGTVDFWFYQRAPFVAGPGVIPHLFSINMGPGADHSWKNAMFLTYGGWNPNVGWVVTDSEGKWVSSVSYLAEKWTANSRWHRIAVSWSTKNKRLSMFVDGRLVSQTNNAQLLPSLLPCFYIGSNRGWQGFAPHNYDEFRILDREITEAEASIDYARDYEFTNDDSFRPEAVMVPIDLSKVAQTPFEDDEPNNQKGGWSDQGPLNDWRTAPRGKQDVMGIPFVIGEKCIALANAKRQYYPQEATIDINAEFGGLFFIHTAPCLMAADRTCGRYEIEYTDGTKEIVPLETYKNIGDWWYAFDMPHARPVLQTRGGGDGNVGAFIYFWANPHPGKTIKRVIFKTANDEAMTILVAITGVKPGLPGYVYRGLQIATCRQVDVEAELAEAIKKYQAQLPELAKIKADLSKINITDKQKAAFYGREALRYADEASIYVQEVEGLKSEIDTIIKNKDAARMRTLEKVASYIVYAGELTKRIPELLAKADKAVPMAPITPSPAKFPAQAGDLLKKHLRSEIVLNGMWDANYAADPQQPGKDWTPLLIPVDYHGQTSTWLKKSLVIPAEWSGKRMELWFESSRELTEVYVNRKFAGRHIGIEPFGVDISDKLVPGAANEILLFVGGKCYVTNPYNNTTNYVTNGWSQPCITQDVTLKVSPRTCILDPYARIDSENNFILTGKIVNASGSEYELEAAIQSDKNSHSFGKFRIIPDTQGMFQIKAKWEKPILWGIGGEYQEPRLVFVNMKLSDKTGEVDEMSFRTGFRHFEIRDKIYFYLNGKKIILQGDHLWSSEGHNAASTRASITRFYRIAREANFNVVRFHIIDTGNTYPADLDAGDELGFLVEPECSTSAPPILTNGESNYDDPVFRKNSEVYHRVFARKARVHPSVCIFSLSNEVFQVAGRHLDDASKYFLAMEKIMHEEMPNVVLTEQGNNWRKEFATADVHYSGGVAFKDWKKRGDKPLIHGEWCFYEGGYFEMNHSSDKAKARQAEKATAEHFERAIKEEIANGVAGTMPFPAFFIYSFCTADESLMGPWAKEILADKPYFDANRWYMPHARGTMVPITWPAFSGKGVKMKQTYTGSQGDNINFWEPTRKEYTPNAVHGAFKRAFTPMPPVKATMIPEVIVTVKPENAAYPVLVKRDGDSTLMGVLPDKDGKAWFELPADGPYTFVVINENAVKQVDRVMNGKPVAQPPGYGYIEQIDMK